MYIKKGFFYCLFFYCFTLFSQTETTLYSSDGTPAYYIEEKSFVIYSFAGDPVAYLCSSNSNGFNVYDFNGNHLGWYDGGLMRNHAGKIGGFKKDAISNVICKFETIKNFKKIEPIKNIKSIEPMRPIYSNTFAYDNLSYFFVPITNPSESSKAVYANQTYVPLISNFTPDYDFYSKVLSNMQAQHDNLIKNGYVYDFDTDSYIEQTQYEIIKKKRLDDIVSAINIWSATDFVKNSKEVKSGFHTAYYFSITHSYPTLKRAEVFVKKGKIKYLLINNKKWATFDATKIKKGSSTSGYKSGTKLQTFFFSHKFYTNHLFLLIN